MSPDSLKKKNITLDYTHLSHNGNNEDADRKYFLNKNMLICSSRRMGRCEFVGRKIKDILDRYPINIILILT